MTRGAEGLTALPLPAGDAAGMWSAAGLLRAASVAAVGGPVAVAGGRLPSLGGGWTGAAADEARSEVGIVCAREHALADRAVRAAVVLASYGDALDEAQRAVVGLQATWDATVPVDPLLALPSAELALLSGQHAAVLADLELAAAVAAHRLRELVAEVVAVDRPGRTAQPLLGWGDPFPSDAAVAGAVTAGLPIVRGAAAAADADRLAEEVEGQLLSAASGDPAAAERAVLLLGARMLDPVVAQALWQRLDPRETALVLAAAGPAVADALGASLATAANPAYASGLDPATTSRLDAWRGPWLAALAVSAGIAVTRADRAPVGGAWVQGRLLAAAHRAGLSPGVAYASTVAVAVVATDRAARSGADRRSVAALGDGGGVVRSAPPQDTVVAVAQALAADAAAARAWLLAPLPGTDHELVVEHLVAGRYSTMDAHHAAASMTAVARLVGQVGTDVTDRQAVQVASAFVGAVAASSQAPPDGTVFRRSLTGALPDLGTLLARHPDAVAAAVDGSAAPGRDAPLTAYDRLDRLVGAGRDPGTWQIVIPDRQALGRLAGELAFDGADGADGAAPRDPRHAPALAPVVAAVGARLEEDLVAAVAADHAGDPHALEAAARRLGTTTGFVLTSAGEALARRDADADTRHAAVAGVVGSAVDKVALPGPVGSVATPLVHLAAHRAVDALLPVGAAPAQREATRIATAAAQEAAYVEVRSMVSRAQPWTAEQSPRHWAQAAGAGAGVAPFWDERDVPLPEDEMTTAQRRAFSLWRREAQLSVYDTAPGDVRDAIDAGVADALASTQRAS